MEFKDFFYSYYQPLYNYAYAILKDEVLAEDAVQELFVDVWEKDRLDTIEYPDRYMLRGVKFKCLNVLRAKGKRPTVPFVDLSDWDQAYDPISEEEILPLLHFFAAKLPPKTREIFLLSREEGLSYKEIAEQKNISVKTVENQMGRALKIMRKLLKEHQMLLLLAAMRL